MPAAGRKGSFVHPNHVCRSRSLLTVCSGSPWLMLCGILQDRRDQPRQLPLAAGFPKTNILPPTTTVVTFTDHLTCTKIEKLKIRKMHCTGGGECGWRCCSRWVCNFKVIIYIFGIYACALYMMLCPRCTKDCQGSINSSRRGRSLDRSVRHGCARFRPTARADS